AAIQSPADVAIAQASAAVPRYLAMLDMLYSDSKITINDIYGVAVAPESTTEALAIARFRSAGDRQTGQLKLVNISSPTADLSPGGATSKPKYPAVTLTACVDVAGTAAAGGDGKSVAQPGRPPYLIEHLTLVNISYPSSTAWRVSNAPNKQATSCGG
ncbi:MAG: hypothetical protein M3O36_05315, partial [Myxococcota bacterium]|nr:hypothetical protein [Myxococcota bacterium]